MPEERSLGGDVSIPDAPPTPAAAEHPLGNPNPPSIDPPAVSIVDTILQLDEFLSGDVRRAEKTARFCTKPWLEAEIDERAFELDRLTDAQGNPLQGREQEAREVALQIQTLQAEYGAAFRSVRMGQLPSDDWQKFRAQWREEMASPPYSDAFYDALIGACAVLPKITVDQAGQLRKKLGDPQMDLLAQAAFDVNTKSGVSIPKSPLSSHVLRRAARAQS